MNNIIFICMCNKLICISSYTYLIPVLTVLMKHIGLVTGILFIKVNGLPIIVV